MIFYGPLESERMSKVIIALLILAFFAIMFLLFCIIVLTFALLIFARKGGGREPKMRRLLSIGKLDF